MCLLFAIVLALLQFRVIRDSHLPFLCYGILFFTAAFCFVSMPTVGNVFPVDTKEVGTYNIQHTNIHTHPFIRVALVTQSRWTRRCDRVREKSSECTNATPGRGRGVRPTPGIFVWNHPHCARRVVTCRTPHVILNGIFGGFFCWFARFLTFVGTVPKRQRRAQRRRRVLCTRRTDARTICTHTHIHVWLWKLVLRPLNNRYFGNIRHWFLIEYRAVFLTNNLQYKTL